MTRLKVLERLLKMVLPFPSTFKTAQWLLLCNFYLFLGAVINLFLPGVLLVASFASAFVFLGGLVTTLRHRREVFFEETISRYFKRISRPIKKSKFPQEIELHLKLPPHRGSRIKRIKESMKKIPKRLLIVDFAVPVLLLVFFYVFRIDQAISGLLLGFIDHLASDSSALTTFITLTSSSVTGLTMLAVIVLYLPTSVIREIEHKKMEFGILGTMLFTLSDILVLIEGIQGISTHYPKMISLVNIGMSLAFVCIISSWAMGIFLLTKGITRWNISHFLLAATMGVYAAITIFYAITELLCLLLGLGAG